jgi:hypothetical protein
MKLQEAIKRGKAQKVAVSVLSGGQVQERFVITVQVSRSHLCSSKLHGHLLLLGSFSDEYDDLCDVTIDKASILV